MEKQEEIWQAVGRITINFPLLECDKCALTVMRWLFCDWWTNWFVVLWVVKMIGLFELLQKIEKNSGMYLGRQSVSDLFMFLAGYEFARSQINGELTPEEEDFYNEFQPWLQQKLGIRSVTSWAKLIMLSCHDEKTGFEMFFRFLREFQVRDRIKQVVTA